MTQAAEKLISSTGRGRFTPTVICLVTGPHVGELVVTVNVVFCVKFAVLTLEPVVDNRLSAGDQVKVAPARSEVADRVEDSFLLTVLGEAETVTLGLENAVTLTSAEVVDPQAVVNTMYVVVLDGVIVKVEAVERTVPRFSVLNHRYVAFVMLEVAVRVTGLPRQIEVLLADAVVAVGVATVTITSRLVGVPQEVVAVTVYVVVAVGWTVTTPPVDGITPAGDDQT